MFCFWILICRRGGWLLLPSGKETTTLKGAVSRAPWGGLISPGLDRCDVTCGLDHLNMAHQRTSHMTLHHNKLIGIAEQHGMLAAPLTKTI